MNMPAVLLFIQNIGPTEMLMILVVALLVFGGRLPTVARNLGKSFVEFKKGLRDLNSELRNELDTTDQSPPRPREKLPQPPVSQPTPAATEQKADPASSPPPATASTASTSTSAAPVSTAPVSTTPVSTTPVSTTPTQPPNS